MPQKQITCTRAGAEKLRVYLHYGYKILEDYRVKKTILACTLMLAVLFTLTGCGSKEAIVMGTFTQKMEAEGFTIVDATDQFETDDVNSVTLAMKEEYQIEFYEITSESLAIGSFQQNKSTFESYKGNSSAESSVSMGNYSTYALTTGDMYYYISRVDTTMLYMAIPVTYKEEAKEIVESLGY